MSDTPRMDLALRKAQEDCTESYLLTEGLKLERELNAANDRIKRLEEAGDAMTNCIACGCSDGGCTICRGYEDKWTKAKEAKL